MEREVISFHRIAGKVAGIERKRGQTKKKKK
jgi:hypothetical protein